MHVWFVDDRAENRATWLASFPDAVRRTCTLRAFESVPALLASVADGARPDVVFVDFFVDGHDGLEVVERFLADDVPTPLLIAHSSLPEANAGLVRAGAHLALAKVKGVPRTESNAQAIGRVEDLRRLVREHVDR